MPRKTTKKNPGTNGLRRVNWKKVSNEPHVYESVDDRSLYITFYLINPLVTDPL